MIKVEREVIEQFAKENGIEAINNYIVVQPLHHAPKGVRRLLDGLTGGKKRDVIGGENLLLFVSPKELIFVKLDENGRPVAIEEGLGRGLIQELEYLPEDGYGHLLFKTNKKQRVYKVPFLLPLADWHCKNLKALKEVQFYS